MTPKISEKYLSSGHVEYNRPWKKTFSLIAQFLENCLKSSGKPLTLFTNGFVFIEMT